MSDMQAKDLKRGQFMYICEAALEYLISILVGGSFLATLTGELGFSDSLTGILSSVISLGCIFQMLSIFLRRKKVKWFVIGMSVTNQLLFMLLYVIPVFEISGTIKTILFVVFIFTAGFNIMFEYLFINIRREILIYLTLWLCVIVLCFAICRELLFDYLYENLPGFLYA